MKKFWKKTEGFTLVELIVVIAILGILAGVGTVGYSGYIKKANLAADQQLLASLNTAFATACIENGVDARTLTASEATATLTGDDGAKILSAITPADYQDEFDKYYKGGTFKVFEALYYNAETGGFENDGVYEYDYNGTTVYVSASTVALLSKSTFGTEIGATALLNQVDYVAGFASAMSSEAFDKVLGDVGYQKSFLEAVGYEFGDSVTNDEIAMRFEDYSLELAIANAAADATDEDIENLQSKIKANMAVLYAAQNSTTSQADMIAMLSTAGAKDKIVSTMSNDPGTGLAMAANAYGMYYAYAEKTGNATIDITDPLGVLRAFESDVAFQEWMKSDDATADMNAYYAAMDTISTNVNGNADATTDVLVNGFGYDSATDTGNKALNDLLSGIMG